MERSKGLEAMEQSGKKDNVSTPRRTAAIPLGRSLRANSTRASGTECSPILRGSILEKDRNEKRKNLSPADGEGVRIKRHSNDGSEETSDEDENLDDTMVEVDEDKAEEEPWKRNMERAIDDSSITEVMKLLKQVMADYRQTAKDLEREKEWIGRQGTSEMKKGLEDLKINLKNYFNASNEKWRKNIKMELGKMNTEVHSLRREVDEWKVKGWGHRSRLMRNSGRKWGV